MSEDYEPQWRDFRRRTWFLFGAMFGVVPYALLVFEVLGVDESEFWVVLPWPVIFSFAAYRYGTFKCPRCRKSFTTKGDSGNAFALKCVNCGLRRGAPAGSD